MIQDWIIPTKNEIDAIFEGKPNMKDAPDLAALIIILKYIEDKTEDLTKDIKRTLKTAEKHIYTYRETGDKDFVTMAYDLSTHARKLIEMAVAKSNDMSMYQKWLQELQDQISKL